MGDVRNAYDRITGEHRLCPDAQPCDHQPDGSVKVHVSFEATVIAEHDDPALVQRKESERKRKVDEAKERELEARMRPYVAAKRIGESPKPGIMCCANCLSSLSSSG